jgi:spoIIIJ-associated protein
MEWVETTGRTIELAKEAALDELGVDEQDAEFEVIEDAKLGLFGRLRSEARVRARVRPTAPRAKDERRRRSKGGRDGARVASSAKAGSSASTRSEPADSGSAVDEPAAPAAPERSAPAASGSRAPRRRGGTGATERSPSKRSSIPASDHEEEAHVDVALDEQATVARTFLEGLIKEFDVDGQIRIERPDEDTVDLHVDGANLGLLIGPKGVTLLAIQDLTRTVVQRQTGATNGRIHVDISGYRHKRAEALSRFTRQVAAEVLANGKAKALEPMSAADRKVVHDTVGGIDGVTSSSEGEDANRRVVISPEDS